MAQCKARTGKGARCQAKALKNSAFCFTHDPACGKARAAAHRRGGERRRVDHSCDASKVPAQVRSIADAMVILDYTLAEVIPMENSLQRGRLLIALSEAYIKALEVGELERRLQELEQKVFANDNQTANPTI
jgi:hypothetical protein